MKRSVRNNELQIPKSKRVFLTYDLESFVPCTLEETDEEVVFSFDVARLKPIDTVYEMTRQDQCRFLINCGNLLHCFEEYDFSLSPDNLVVDINLNPQVLLRDFQLNGSGEFAVGYMALIAALLAPKYSYDDYLQGGQGLYRKKAFLEKLSKLDSVHEMQQCLREEYEDICVRVKRTKVSIHKKIVMLYKVLVPVLALLLLVCAGLIYKTVFIDIPYRDAVISANAHYLQMDYIGTQEALASIPADEMTPESKYILARSYIMTEELSAARKEASLAGISFEAEPILMDYWIYLGRLQFAEAVDAAQRLGDDDLLLVAYQKQLAFLERDTTLPGEEKAAQISSLEKSISDLLKKGGQ